MGTAHRAQYKTLSCACVWKRSAMRLRFCSYCSFCPSCDGLLQRLYCKMLIVACDVSGFVSGACECVHAMDNAVHGCDGGLGEVMMSELHCVRDLWRAGGFFQNFVAAVLLQRYTNIPSVCTAESPRISSPCIFVCNYVTSERSDGCSVIIKRFVEVRPCRSRGVEGCLPE